MLIWADLECRATARSCSSLGEPMPKAKPRGEARNPTIVSSVMDPRMDSQDLARDLLSEYSRVIAEYPDRGLSAVSRDWNRARESAARGPGRRLSDTQVRDLDRAVRALQALEREGGLTAYDDLLERLEESVRVAHLHEWVHIAYGDLAAAVANRLRRRNGRQTELASRFRELLGRLRAVPVSTPGTEDEQG